ncbi:MAG: AMP-binding protein [Oscillospiraceae bacterium]|jgi:acetyl-CoA synthetase|nr:AMP-binding protein [Oscillospiraceae bacterium]
MLPRFLDRIEFDSYNDFKEHFKINVPDNFNFGFDVVDAWAEKEPNKRALLWVDDYGHERAFTFGDISRLSNRAGNYLSSIGVKKGDLVMLILRRRWEYWVCATALHKLGAIAVPGSLQMTQKDIAYRADSGNVKTIICVDDDFVIGQAEQASASAASLTNFIIVNGGQRETNTREGRWIDLDRVLEDETISDDRTLERVTRNDDIMLIYFTSGTTKMPKMVAHSFTHPLGHIVTAKYWQRVEENKLHMSVADSAWAKFGWGKIYGQWICGATVFGYDMDKFIPAKLLSMIEKYQVTTFCAPPTMYRFMLQEDLKKYDLSSVHHCATAGEPLNPEVVKQWREFTGHTIYEGFGQSEGPVLLANFGWDDVKPGSTGKPSPNTDAIILNANGKETEDGEEGSVCVPATKPVGLFIGYYGDEEATEEALGGDYYNLHDMAWRDSDGYYYFVGRSDDMIKSSGYRIGPFEVESALIEHPAVVECAITGAPDPIRGQIIKATVVLANGYAPGDALVKELQDHVKRVTAPYKYPRIVEFVDELPKTIGGKIKRAEIRKNNG